ncbi:hypothetical protein H5T53_00310 [Candidatus Bipolaricaulota bacterium]|nr:hypothetical protein [Candidatus Bipolaricaulota bacterium]
MRRTTALVGLIVLGLAFLPAWAEETAAPPTKLGVGGSFMAGSPVFDIFAQIPVGESQGIRFTLSTMFAAAGFYAFVADGAFLITLPLEGFHPYFGGGGGAFMVIDPVGNVIGAFTVNGLGGAFWPLGEGFGLYAQIRFLGVLLPAGFQGNLAPGLGLYVSF